MINQSEWIVKARKSFAIAYSFDQVVRNGGSLWQEQEDGCKPLWNEFNQKFKV